MNKILVIGSTNIDMIACVKHLPRPGETVGEARFMQSNGGKGANQAVAAARLGGDVAFVSCLGDDAGAAALRQQFAADGINTEALFTAKDTPTGTALIFVSQDGDAVLATASRARRSTPWRTASPEPNTCSYSSKSRWKRWPAPSKRHMRQEPA